MGQIQLKNSDVNSGTAVWLTAAKLTFGFKNLTKTDPAEGKFDTIESDYGGFENPRITINGQIDIDNEPANSITPILLYNFGTATQNPTYLAVPVGSTDHYIPGIRMYNSSGTEIGTTRISLANSDTKYTTDTTEGWIRVRIQSFTINIDNTSDKGHFLTYQIVCHETS